MIYCIQMKKKFRKVICKRLYVIKKLLKTENSKKLHFRLKITFENEESDKLSY